MNKDYLKRQEEQQRKNTEYHKSQIEVKKFRKKPVVIEAVQLTPNNVLHVGEWCGSTDYGWVDNNAYVNIKTLEGTMTAIVNDWIIKGLAGEFYPCKPDIFDKSYEEEKSDD